MIRLLQGIAGLTGWRRAALALASGCAAALSMPPINLWPLLFIAFPVLLLLLGGQPLRGWRSGFGTGWCFGFGYFVTAFHWIGFAFLVDAATYLWMMPFMLGALSGGMSVYWGLAALAARRFGGSGLPLVLMFAACLGTAEWLRGHLLTGFPWAAPGLAVDGMGAVAQLGAIFGMPGLTVLIVLWAGVPLVLIGNGSPAAKVAAVALLALLPAGWGLGGLRLASASDAVVPGVTLRIAQPNIGQQQKWREDNARAIFDTLKTLSAEPTAVRPQGIAGVTHLIWPESAVPFLIDESPVARAELKPLLGGRTVLITGSLRRDAADAGRIFNSVIAFDGATEVVVRYDKWRLVPGGEFLPFESLLEPLGFRKVVTVPGSFQPGAGPVTVAVPGLPAAAMLICYEAIFPHDLVDAANRPGVLINVTNDGWFGRSTGPHQHLAQARLRAIEQGLPIVRAANTGISAVIDSYGRYKEKLPLLQPGVVDSDLPLALPSTLYARWGDTIAFGLIFLLLMGASFTRALTVQVPFWPRRA
jgi:apolipoprotein N-acyltransferase